MLDRSIPFYNMILKCSAYKPFAITLPKGFFFKQFEPGDEIAWAALEHEIGDFSSPEEALAYFQKAYGASPEELRRRAVVLANDTGINGFCIAWRDFRQGVPVASLHWLVVSPAWEGKGLGRALVQKTLELYEKLGEFPVYLHTQPWSYRALMLYLHLDFRLQKEDTFSAYENQYWEAVGALEEILSPERFQELLEASE